MWTRVVPVLFTGCMMPGGHGVHGTLPPPPQLIQPEPAGELRPTKTALDENADPTIVEINLIAAPATIAYLDGRPTSAFAYNGSVPGPTIEANKGDEIVVHFTNNLTEPTTIHWHGLRVPNDMDGAGRLAQPIPPGSGFDYRFVVPDAGTFWYHPHVRSDVQVAQGLYGAVVVRDPDEPALDAANDQVLVLSDVLVDQTSGRIDDHRDMRGMMMGQEGNLLLINGQPSNRAITVAPGARTRLRLVNAASARFFSLRLDGGTLVQIGTDGGLLPAPRVVSSLLLTPGERADVAVETIAGATLTSVGYERAMGAGAGETADLVRFVAVGPLVTPRPLPATLRATDVLASTGRIGISRLGERMAHHEWLFTINDRTFPNVPPLTAPLGTRPSWTIDNESDMDHPFHLHGFFFQRQGVPEWKDTINVPARSSMEIVVDLGLRPGAAGEWMYHCHILEHAERGMMGALVLQ